MSPFRQPNQPSTNTPGLRGEEGIRRRIGREGGEWERERESDFKVEREGKKGVGELMRNYFEQNFLQPFDGWRQTGVALADYQRFRLSIECLSLLLQVSAEEDHMGILNVSGYFEDSICSLLSCLIALEIHMRTTSPPHPKTSQSVRLPSYSLLLVLQNAIYSIVVKYYSSLSSLKLPPSHTQKLQEFVSFQVM
uniref:Uncharacterized protein n=2 Tax=Paramoeba aestuarina TaxID=180227 RepID=A0A7S4NTP5_9EUKA|mmetsp:Transcript_26218/g.40870  ORF Transcript_26218/g.40870 Transcript_26218/m.40870 type:complete len:194 (+) Transcript_26218:92-673(+)